MQKRLTQIAAAVAIALAGTQAQAGVVNINGVEFESGAQFVSTTIWESSLTSSNDILSGVGLVESIKMTSGVVPVTTWQDGNNNTELTYYFKDYAVAQWRDTFGTWTAAGTDVSVNGDLFSNAATALEFTGGTVDFFTDLKVGGTNLAIGLGTSPAAAITAATDGAEFLNYVGHSFTSVLTGSSITLVGSVPGFGTNVHVANQGLGYLDIDLGGAGAANSNFDTDSWDLTAQGDGVADALFNSNVSNTNCSTFQLCGTADMKTSAIPEPATLALFGLGLMGLGRMTRNKKS